MGKNNVKVIMYRVLHVIAMYIIGFDVVRFGISLNKCLGNYAMHTERNNVIDHYFLINVFNSRTRAITRVFCSAQTFLRHLYIVLSMQAPTYADFSHHQQTSEAGFSSFRIFI